MADDSRMGLLKANEIKVKPKQTIGGNELTHQQETDEDEREFLDLIDIDLERSIIDSAMEKFDETLFDSFQFTLIMGPHSLQYMTFRIFSHFNFFNLFGIQMERVVNFSREVNFIPQ
jgi:hypothetical protein